MTAINPYIDFTQYQIPFMYSLSEQVVNYLRKNKTDQQVFNPQSQIAILHGYNDRKKETVTSTRTITPATYNDDDSVKTTGNTVYDVSLKYYLYDLTYATNGNKQPWQVGFQRGNYSFEDTVVMTVDLSLMVKDPSNPAAGYLLSKIPPAPNVVWTAHDMTTGKLQYQTALTVVDDSVSNSVDLSMGLRDLTESVLDVASNFTSAGGPYDSFAYTLFAALLAVDASTNFSQFQTSNTQYVDLSPLAAIPIPYIYNNRFTSYTEISAIQYSQQVYSSIPEGIVTDIINAPIPRLQRVSALDTGTWSFYPLGSSPGECVARLRKIPFNNVNFVTDSHYAGVLQVMTAVEADVRYNFETQTGLNLSDYKNLSQAVNSYIRVMAAGIISNLNLPRQFQSYLAAKIEWALFALDPLPDDITNQLTIMMPFIMQDYSISAEVETVDKMLGYYNTYRSIYSYDGSYYNTTTGYNVSSLGVSADDVSDILMQLSVYQELFLRIAYVKEFNALAQLSKSTGRVNLLDKSVVLFPRMSQTVYVGYKNVDDLICTNVNFSLSADARFNITAEFVKKLVL